MVLLIYLFFSDFYIENYVHGAVMRLCFAKYARVNVKVAFKLKRFGRDLTQFANGEMSDCFRVLWYIVQQFLKDYKSKKCNKITKVKIVIYLKLFLKVMFGMLIILQFFVVVDVELFQGERVWWSSQISFPVNKRIKNDDRENIFRGYLLIL